MTVTLTKTKPKIVKRRRPKAKIIRRKYAPRAVYLRSVENRRVMLLELLAYAIEQVERAETSLELTEFEEATLRSTRERTWGMRPWPKAAKSEDAFMKDLKDMATGFVAEVGAVGYQGEGFRYRNRAHAPEAP